MGSMAAGRLSSTAQLVLASAVVRAAMIAWGQYQDAHFQVKYTDIDYQVFTDAARFVSEGASPYRRSTYRYSPLLAYLLLPNISLHPACGKVLFAAADILVALLLAQLLTLQQRAAPAGAGGKAAQQADYARYIQYALLAWLYNPYTFTISTRGSCDALIVALLLLLLRLLAHSGSILCSTAAGLLYGFAVHFRVYPVIYAPALGLFLLKRQLRYMMASSAWSSGSQRRPGPGSKPTRSSSSSDSGSSDGGRSSIRWGVGSVLRLLAPAAAFGVAAAAVFAALGLLFYRLYGMEFVHEAFLYHGSRQDPRHSFSPYYYPTYLSMAAPGDVRTALAAQSSAWTAAVRHAAERYGARSLHARALGLMARAHPWLVRYAPDAARAAWMPQVACLLALSWRFHEELPVALMLCTWAFVTFNKVVTAQYFVWYLSLLPLALPALLRQRRVAARVLLGAGGAWVATQLHWLAWAYQLEMQGRPVHLALWAAGIIFMAANVLMIVVLTCALAPAKPVSSSTDTASCGSECGTTFLGACVAADLRRGGLLHAEGGAAGPVGPHAHAE